MEHGVRTCRLAEGVRGMVWGRGGFGQVGVEG